MKADVQMDVLPVLDLLRQKIGLNPKSIGTAPIERAVRECIEAAGAVSVEDYINMINGSLAELGRLIESVVVRETSFFRNTTPFVTLHSHLKQFILNKNRVGPLRILCLPCSTGEEAYSIAMVLFDLHLSANQFFIFAGDISEQALQIAKSGRYSSYSFRGEDIAFRSEYFTKQSDGSYILEKKVCDAVHFEQANILSDGFLPGHKPYDVIFCRNLLIYFDDAAKGKAIKALSERLSNEGVLFVGHAEGASILEFGFASLDYPMSFAFAKDAYASVINDALNVNNPAKNNFSPPVAVQKKMFKPEMLSDAGKVAPIASEPGKHGENHISSQEIKQRNSIASDIATARRLANSGSFSAAVFICEQLLSEGAEPAEIYYLLGQVAGAIGDHFQAEEYLRKAIYLDADCYDALIYLSTIFDLMGNPEKAASFRKRAQRVKQRNKEGAEK